MTTSDCTCHPAVLEAGRYDGRDLKDNKFLALAIDARAVCIVTGDADLLALDPYRGITVCTPAEFLAARPESP